MLVHWLYFFLLLWGVCKASNDSNEDTESQKKETEVANLTMAPNSKFLNPHLDDETNLQHAIAAFVEDSKTPDNNKNNRSKTNGLIPQTTEEDEGSDILKKLSESWELKMSSREQKSLDNWKIIPLLNSLLNRGKHYKLKSI